MRKLLVAIVVSLFGSSLALSLTALNDAGTDARVSIPPLWPWIIDGFILAMSLVIVEARRQGRRVTWWPRIGLYGVTGLSAWIQWVYATGPWTDHALHAMAPGAALWSFECLMWLLYGTYDRAARGTVEEPSNRPVDDPVAGDQPPRLEDNNRPGWTPVEPPSNRPVGDPVQAPPPARLEELEPPRLDGDQPPGSTPVQPPSTAPVDRLQPPRSNRPPTARSRQSANRGKPPAATARSKARGRPSPEEITARADRAEAFVADYLTEYHQLPSGGAVAKAVGAPDASWGRAYLREHGDRLAAQALGESAEVLQLHAH